MATMQNKKNWEIENFLEKNDELTMYAEFVFSLIILFPACRRLTFSQNECANQKFIERSLAYFVHVYVFSSSHRRNKNKQAGAELCQAKHSLS